MIYIIGKHALNTCELYRLLALPNFRDLAECLVEGGIHDDPGPLARAELLLTAVDASGLPAQAEALFKRSADDPNKVITTQLGIEIDALAKHTLAEAGLSYNPQRSLAFLSTKAVLLGERIKAICKGWYPDLGSSHVRFNFKPGAPSDLDKRFYDENDEPLPIQGMQDINATLDNDPSMSVWYDQKSDRNTDWKLFGDTDLKRTDHPKNWTVYLSPD